MKPAIRRPYPRTRILVSVLFVLFQASSPVLANPRGPVVVHGQAGFSSPAPGTFQVTNTPGAIINWQGFSIDAGELTRFVQQSPQSAVLNRVVGSDLSQLMGTLGSNGRVFLVNPHGMVFGSGAVIDTAGFVASTLDITDADFLAGRLRFDGDASSGGIVNQGTITAGGGDVLLIAPNIENSGLIQTRGGTLLLAAGRSVTITSLDAKGVLFEVQAPSDKAVNLGRLIADGGAVEVFAGTIRHGGEIRADSVGVDPAGNVVLRAQGDVTLEPGSVVSAAGGAGGRVVVESLHGDTVVSGRVSATGVEGSGGAVEVLGDRVFLRSGASVDVSGADGGGAALIGGDFQGGNPEVRNARSTIVVNDVTIHADAGTAGDGGRVIVWSDGATRFYGTVSARGGAGGGDGGFVEVSGKRNLDFNGYVNLTAASGRAGTLLLDPEEMLVSDGATAEAATGETRTGRPGRNGRTLGGCSHGRPCSRDRHR